MTNEQAGQAHWSLVDTCERSRVGHQRHYVNSVQFSYIALYAPYETSDYAKVIHSNAA